MNWQGRKILLGITGSIAAYKSALVVRQLKSKGAEVQVVCTPDALGFVTPLTLSTLSERPVYSEFVKSAHGEWVNHVELGIWAELILIAPCSAHTLAKMSAGLCDNLLLAVYLSARCPVWFAPAMDLDMWRHPATVRNVAELVGRPGHRMLGPASGALASGLNGVGRMVEPEALMDEMESHWPEPAGTLQTNCEGALTGKIVLITAGPTREAIDDVRYISNHSTGRMGYALAEACVAQGARVVLISGPVALPPPQGLHRFVTAESAVDMQQAIEPYQSTFDVGIFCAAVADFRPAQKVNGKIKKKGGALSIELLPNPDLLAEAGRNKQHNQFIVGFALEAHSGLPEARRKKSEKNCDMMILNQLSDEGAGFGVETNRVTLLSDLGETTLPLANKTDLAHDIIQQLILCLSHS